MKHYILFGLLFFCPAYSAIFTIENYTGKDTTVEIVLNKSWGSKGMKAPIKYGAKYRFDTGIYGVVPKGIRWDNGKMFIDNLPISATSIGLVIRLFKDKYEYMKTKSIRGLMSGDFPEGSGLVSHAY